MGVCTCKYVPNRAPECFKCKFPGGIASKVQRFLELCEEYRNSVVEDNFASSSYKEWRELRDFLEEYYETV